MHVFKMVIADVKIGLVFLATLLASTTAGTAQEAGFRDDVVRTCFEGSASVKVRPGCIGQASNICQSTRPGGSTTRSIEGCLQEEVSVWDRLLNEAYQASRTALKAMDEGSQPGPFNRVEALRDAQRAWVAFRDAECNLVYALYQDGSIRSVLHSTCNLELTAKRALELRDMLGVQ